MGKWGGDSGDAIAFFLLLDKYDEFSFGLHARTLLRKSLSRRDQVIVGTVQWETCRRIVAVKESGVGGQRKNLARRVKSLSTKGKSN